MDLPLAILTILTALKDLDRRLFILLNSRLTNPVFDFLFPYFRNALFWLPLYLFLLVFLIVNFGKRAIIWALLLIATVSATDLIGARIFKEGFQRLRPCNDPDLAGKVRLLLMQCSPSFSFVSNHAANHFGMACFIYFTFRKVTGNWIAIVFLWAFLIGYAQVYVGIHYPLDVVCGALLGVLAGTLTSGLFLRRWGNLHLVHN